MQLRFFQPPFLGYSVDVAELSVCWDWNGEIHSVMAFNILCTCVRVWLK